VKRAAASLLVGSALGVSLRTSYRLLAGGALTIDLGAGRRLQPLGPLALTIRVPPEVVFDVIASPYLGRTARALAEKLRSGSGARTWCSRPISPR
jgi:hypothetical protein